MPMIAKSILRHWDQDPRRLIGIIAPNNRVREHYFDALQHCEVELDNDRPWIKTFHGNHNPIVPFDRGGVLVINAQACKGMEFDTVVLADIDEHRLHSTDVGNDVARKLFYVMVSRAKGRVVLFAQPDNGAIERLLPQDENVLRRQNLKGSPRGGR